MHNQRMLKRRIGRILFAVLLLLLAAGFVRVAGGWVLGVPPYVQFMKLVHDDIPRLTVAVRLVEGAPFSFPARIVERRRYQLNLEVFFTSPEERIVVAGLVGGPIAQPVNAGLPPGKLPTTIRVTVTDQEQRVVYDQTQTSDGRYATAANSLTRPLAAPVLDEGRYTVSVTPLNDMTGFAPFRTDLELTYRSK